MSKLKNWLIVACGIDEQHAHNLVESLKDYCVDDVNTLKEILYKIPNFLEIMKIPLLIQPMIKQKLECYDNKPLEKLSISEVCYALTKVFPNNPEYARRIGRMRINGYVLQTTIPPTRKFIFWGVKSEKDAIELHSYIIDWIHQGVPPRFLEKAYLHPDIKPAPKVR